MHSSSRSAAFRVCARRCAGQLHGFVSMAGVVDRAAVALKDISAALAKALRVPAAQNAALAAEA